MAWLGKVALLSRSLSGSSSLPGHTKRRLYALLRALTPGGVLIDLANLCDTNQLARAPS